MIKELRKQKGLTQTELAELILCDRSYISKLEKYPSNHNLTLDMMYYLAYALDTNYLELVAYFAKCRVEFIGKK